MPKDFLYKRKGPWPQPCPEHPFGEAPSVIHVPLKETLDWWLNIGSRYVFTLAYAPIAYLRGIIKPGFDKVSDQEFYQYLTNSMMAKFIKDKLDDKDQLIFGKEINDGSHMIIDLEPVKVVKTFKGIEVSGSKVLMKKQGNDLIILQIYLDKTDSLFSPNDGEGWELAKYFVLQGGALCSTLVVHPLLHFPLDCINAITKTALPKDNLLFQLLYPHTRFTLYLEKAVLTFKTSLLLTKWWMPYAPYPGPYDGLRDLLVEGYCGIEGNDSYSPYEYALKMPEIYGNYGVFHQAYYKVFEKFVNKVLKELTEEDYFYIDHWLNYINAWLPAFPNAQERKDNPDILTAAVTSYLFDVTVGHTVDHYNYGKMNIRQVPLRIRTKVPSKNISTSFDRKNLCTFWDFGKYEMARRLFFSSTTRTRLIDTEYAFTKKSEKFKKVVDEFRSELRQCEEMLEKKSANFMPLNEIAASVQF